MLIGGIEQICMLKYKSIDKRQKGTILPDSVDLVQAQNCPVDLTHAIQFKPRDTGNKGVSHDTV